MALTGAGAEVAITSPHLNECTEVAREIAEHTGKRLLPVRAAAGDRGQVEASVDAVLAWFGRVDILVNNAGINIRHPIAQRPQFAAYTRLKIRRRRRRVVRGKWRRRSIPSRAYRSGTHRHRPRAMAATMAAATSLELFDGT